MNTDKKRWLILAAACLVNLCLGSIYAWSVFASSMYVHSIGSNLGMFTNPGAVPHNAYPFVTISGGDGDLLQRCGICDAYKPKKSHHCRFAIIFCVHRIGFVTDAF